MGAISSSKYVWENLIKKVAKVIPVGRVKIVLVDKVTVVPDMVRITQKTTPIECGLKKTKDAGKVVLENIKFFATLTP